MTVAQYRARHRMIMIELAKRKKEERKAKEIKETKTEELKQEEIKEEIPIRDKCSRCSIYFNKPSFNFKGVLHNNKWYCEDCFERYI